MSDPARLFQTLNLDDMPVTRSQSQIPPQRGGRSPRGGGRRRGRGRAQPQVGPIRSHSGIQYDTQMLSPTSSRRAAEGLQSEFMVDRLEGFNFGRDRYYAFQLSKPVAVRIHDPAVGADRIFECTCAEFRNKLRPCAHVWWLFDGLHAVRSKDEQGAAAPRPTQLELTAQFSELFPFIAERQATLPRELNRLGVDVPDPDDELPVPDILNDILASFYDDMIPDEVNDDFVNKVSPRISG
ncbi:hypothetical protein ABVK25_009991 [Lepraria finkii]|uniref:SWIM-type domain-containing protein n=1 Tax=Lepraria finkii TaxID=1340010 RepID=A0ABR4AVR8_9LECA